MFLRTIELSFLVPGVVSPSLLAAFAVPSAYGDIVASIIAIVATPSLAERAPWAIALVWMFNVWDAGGLLNAVYQGNVHFEVDPGMLGAAFFIPTVIVPPLLVTDGLIFWLLLWSKPSSSAKKNCLESGRHIRFEKIHLAR